VGHASQHVLEVSNWEHFVLEGWLSRHRNKTNFALHMIGIPATVVAIGLLVFKLYWAAALAFVGGYALQFLGHVIEGNQSGEEQLFRRIFRKK
jgi:hypothetical protein